MKLLLPAICVTTLAGCVAMPPPTGRLIAVEGRKTHLHCTGPDASPTVVIEGGLGGPSLFYTRLQQGLAKHTRTCTYDRPGLAWSEATNAPRDAAQIAADLRQLLRNASLNPPYVLAGHSLGGLIVLQFQHEYPAEVAGLALIDSSYPEQVWNQEQMLKTYKMARVAAAVGITRFYNPMRSWFEDLPPSERENLLYFSNRAFIYSAILREVGGLNESAIQAARIETLGDLPLAVVTAGKQCADVKKTTDERRERCERLANDWNARHDRLAALSKRSVRLKIQNADHYSLVTNEAYAQLVVEQIKFVMDQAMAVQ